MPNRAFISDLHNLLGLNSVMPGSEIHILSEDTINKIAAGEVIERPASIIKELLENSIDAGSANITVNIESGGKDLIKVVDDGSGIPGSQMPKTWIRHATSKISCADDLENVLTMGFRGEALSSIAAVAELEIESRFKDENIGQKLTVVNGSQTMIKEIGRDRGTSITVRKLFGNTPVRKKYLTSSRSEQGKILQIVTQLALGNPSISFKVYEDSKCLLHFVKDSLRNRVSEIFGKSVENEMLSVDFKKGKTQVYGYVGTPEHCRGKRSYQYFYINNRYIQSAMLARAFSQAYGGMIPGKYPVGVLFLEMPACDLDVNVHPSKKEIRLVNERDIFSVFHSSIKNTLNKYYALPDLSLSETSEMENNSPVSSAGTGFQYSQDIVSEPGGKSMEQSELFDSGAIRPEDDKIVSISSLSRAGSLGSTSAGGKTHGINTRSSVPYLQLHNTYILFEVNSGLMVVNQQAAHERVLYEEALSILKYSGKLSSQQLLFPEIFDVGNEQADTLNQNLKYFHSLGFQIEYFGGNSFQIRGIPTEVRQNNALHVILDMLLNLEQKKSEQSIMITEMACAYARGASIKNGESLDYHKMANLIDRLFATQNPHISPFGKPAILPFRLEEFHKKFKKE